MTRIKRTKNDAAANSHAIAAADAGQGEGVTVDAQAPAATADAGQDDGVTVDAQAPVASNEGLDAGVTANAQKPVAAAQRILPPGLRPVAMEAISEKERRLACPHRHASARMHARASAIEEKGRPSPLATGNEGGIAKAE
ncbi:MAG: hypothetical protein P4L56_13245 [Candidatus Sulfopaludibacter sp.]|nr:hypothetical protein [Candidatus Sulfopaludibacter sp.]